MVLNSKIRSIMRNSDPFNYPISSNTIAKSKVLIFNANHLGRSWALELP